MNSTLQINKYAINKITKMKRAEVEALHSQDFILWNRARRRRDCISHLFDSLQDSFPPRVLSSSVKCCSIILTFPVSVMLYINNPASRAISQ